VQNKILDDFRQKYLENRVMGVGPSRARFDRRGRVAIKIAPVRDLPDGFSSNPGPRRRSRQSPRGARSVALKRDNATKPAPEIAQWNRYGMTRRPLRPAPAKTNARAGLRQLGHFEMPPLRFPSRRRGVRWIFARIKELASVWERTVLPQEDMQITSAWRTATY